MPFLSPSWDILLLVHLKSEMCLSDGPKLKPVAFWITNVGKHVIAHSALNFSFLCQQKATHKETDIFPLHFSPEP